MNCCKIKKTHFENIYNIEKTSYILNKLTKFIRCNNINETNKSIFVKSIHTNEINLLIEDLNKHLKLLKEIENT
jgi:CRISPR/Cas system CMR subunit Cmr6 (Cas7 group RAMP superfamily)